MSTRSRPDSLFLTFLPLVPEMQTLFSIGFFIHIFSFFFVLLERRELCFCLLRGVASHLEPYATFPFPVSLWPLRKVFLLPITHSSSSGLTFQRVASHSSLRRLSAFASFGFCYRPYHKSALGTLLAYRGTMS